MFTIFYAGIFFSHFLLQKNFLFFNKKWKQIFHNLTIFQFFCIFSLFVAVALRLNVSGYIFIYFYFSFFIFKWFYGAAGQSLFASKNCLRGRKKNVFETFFFSFPWNYFWFFKVKYSKNISKSLKRMIRIYF